MKAFHVRRAAPADAQRLQRVARETFAEAFGAALPPQAMQAIFDDRLTLERFRAELADPGSALFIAEDRDGFQGYAVLQSGPPPLDLEGSALELGRLYVRAERHGAGPGETLMKVCAAEARGRGVRWIWLRVWEANPRARAFYRRWGFREAGREEVALAGLVLPHLLLVKDLDEGGHG